MKAYENLVQFAIQKEHTLSVWDGEEWTIKTSRNQQDIIEVIEAVVDGVRLIIRDSDSKEKVAVAWVCAYGVADDETVLDDDCSQFMEEWWNQFNH